MTDDSFAVFAQLLLTGQPLGDATRESLKNEIDKELAHYRKRIERVRDKLMLAPAATTVRQAMDQEQLTLVWHND